MSDDKNRIWALSALARNFLHMYGSTAAILLGDDPAESEKLTSEVEAMDHMIGELSGYGDAPLSCAFCGRTLVNVGKLVQCSSGICICDECVGECAELLSGKDGER